MEVTQVENVKKIAAKIPNSDRAKRTAMAVEINELAKIILALHASEKRIKQ